MSTKSGDDCNGMTIGFFQTWMSLYHGSRPADMTDWLANGASWWHRLGEQRAAGIMVLLAHLRIPVLREICMGAFEDEPGGAASLRTATPALPDLAPAAAAVKLEESLTTAVVAATAMPSPAAASSVAGALEQSPTTAVVAATAMPSPAAASSMVAALEQSPTTAVVGATRMPPPAAVSPVAAAPAPIAGAEVMSNAAWQQILPVDMADDGMASRARQALNLIFPAWPAMLGEPQAFFVAWVSPRFAREGSALAKQRAPSRLCCKFG